MDNRITGAKTVLIAMDPGRIHVVEQLSYDNNMLYLPLPEPSECMSGSTSLDREQDRSRADKEPRDPAGTFKYLGLYSWRLFIRNNNVAVTNMAIAPVFS